MKSEMRNERREQYHDPFVSYQNRQHSLMEQSLTNQLLTNQLLTNQLLTKQSLTNQLLMLNLLNSNPNLIDNIIIFNGSVCPIFKIGNTEFVKINGKDTVLFSSGPHKFIELNGSIIKVK